MRPRPGAPSLRVDLRLLVIAADENECSATAWTEALERIGVPFDVVTAGAVPIVRTAAGVEGPRRALAFDRRHAHYQGVVVTEEGLAGLSAGERAALDWLQDRFGVRRVVPYAYPGPAWGLVASPEGLASGDGLPDGTLTDPGHRVFGDLAGVVPFDPRAWGHPGARPQRPAGWTTLVAFPDASPALGILHRAGRETCVSLVDANPGMLHARLLIPGVLRWLCRGTHLGHERRYLSVHVDDVLLANTRWDPARRRTAEDGGAVIRMTASDTRRAADWSARTGLRLDLAFNGLGAAGEGQDPLVVALLAEKDAFRWINHTYGHANLDAADAELIVEEVRRNLDVARAHELRVDPSELVTGEHSGLGNPALPVALGRTPARWIAADASSHPEQWEGPGFATVPRHPLNLYHDAATILEQLDEHDLVRSIGADVVATPPTTWKAFVDVEARTVLDHVLGNDPRPHFVHQSNLAEDGVLYPVVDEVLARHTRLFTTPLVQPTLREAGELLRRRTRWRAALRRRSAGGYLHHGRMHLYAREPVEVPVTGIAEGEAYGPTRSGWVTCDGVRVLEPDGDQLLPPARRPAQGRPGPMLGTAATAKDR